jgi:hypothetical protein
MARCLAHVYPKVKAKAVQVKSGAAGKANLHALRSRRTYVLCREVVLRLHHDEQIQDTLHRYYQQAASANISAQNRGVQRVYQRLKIDMRLLL